MSGGLLGGLQYGMRCFAAAFILAMFAKMSPGEKSLTNDLEKLPDGQGEAGTVYVDEYHQFDQCMVQPGYQDVYSHTIAFQLFPDQMNSGTGLLFCYQGQLDRFNHVSGRVMDPLFAVQNMPDNAVGNVCENARHELKSRCHLEDDPEKCEDFVEYPWHGLKVIEDPNDPKNIIINLSTANESFIIARHEFGKFEDDGRLYLKLANQFDVRSIFSRRIGPSSHLREGRIDVSNDFARYYNFMEQMDKGGLFLQEQMGIFALGMDILLKDQRATELPFFIIRSACSEMNAAMLHPFEHSVSSLPKPKAKKKKPNQWVYPLLVENSVLSLRGQIEEGAESFEINLCVIHEWTELICGPVSSTESKVSNITLKYDFLNNKTILQTTLFNSADGSMVNETVVTIEGSALHKGQNFLMKATALNDGFNISLNCAPIEYFPVYEKLPFNRPLNFKISGAAIYEMSKNEPAKTNVLLPESAKVQDNWNVSVGNNDSRPLSNGRGLLFRGNIEFWRIFKLALMINMNDTSKQLFTFDAKNKENKIVLKWLANDNDSCAFTEIENLSAEDAKCNCFELYFEFENNVIKTFLNGEWIYQNSGIASVLEVAHIKLDADINGPLELNKTTWAVTNGTLFDLKDEFVTLNVLNINGKIFDEATQMRISFIYFDENNVLDLEKSPLEQCWTDVANATCHFVLDINIELRLKIILLRRQNWNGIEKEWVDRDTQTIDYSNTTQFEPGKPFELAITAVKKEANAKSGTYKIDQIPQMKAFPKDLDNARFIWVHIDKGVLYEEPKIV